MSRSRGSHPTMTSRGDGKHPKVRPRSSPFGKLIRERRRLLNLTQEDLARRIRVSMPFIGHLETGHRRPSEKTIAKLAKVLGLDQQELFLLANPGTRALFRSHSPDSAGSAWDQFKRNRQLHRAHRITLGEMSLSRLPFKRSLPVNAISSRQDTYPISLS